jgi:hypothetical protein
VKKAIGIAGAVLVSCGIIGGIGYIIKGFTDFDLGAWLDRIFPSGPNVPVDPSEPEEPIPEKTVWVLPYTVFEKTGETLQAHAELADTAKYKRLAVCVRAPAAYEDGESIVVLSNPYITGSDAIADGTVVSKQSADFPWTDYFRITASASSVSGIDIKLERYWGGSLTELGSLTMCERMLGITSEEYTEDLSDYFKE